MDDSSYFVSHHPFLTPLLGKGAAGALAQMRKSGELKAHLPEVDRLYGVPQVAQHHPEVDTGVHIELCLAAAERLKASASAMFAVLVHDLGKGLTPADQWPRHVDHETAGLEPVKAVCDRFNVQGHARKVALLVCEYHLHVHRCLEMRASSVLRLLFETGLEFHPQLFEDFVTACEADARGRLGLENREYFQSSFLRAVWKQLAVIPMPYGVTPQDNEGADQHRVRLGLVKAEQLKVAEARSAASSQTVAC